MHSEQGFNGLEKNELQAELQLEEVRMLSDYATQARFTWAVIFLAFIAGLVGLLPLIKQYGSNYGWLLTGLLSFTYIMLDFGLSLSFYKICYTSFLLNHLTPLRNACCQELC